jgi:3-oxoacyl-[acyl-carrier-protein] synthase III
MKIKSIDIALPSRRMTNEHIIDLIREHSAAGFQGDLDGTLDRIGRTLTLTGARERRWLAKGERPIDFVTAAANGALGKAQLNPDDIDLLIYVGVGKGFIEPAQSYLVAHALGWKNTECFDILDACMSWMRALQIADSHFRSGRYRNICVVNAEFVPMEGGAIYPAAYKLGSAEDVEWSFPAYTVGCAASAIILSADNDNLWEWGFASKPMLADLCTIPIYGWQDYSKSGEERIGRGGAYRFTSYGGELHNQGAPHAIDLFRRSVKQPDQIKAVMTHTSSLREWKKITGAVGLSDRLVCPYPDYGNLVSASVPVGLSLELAAGRIKRGDRLAFFVGSAGMSFAVCTFDY